MTSLLLEQSPAIERNFEHDPHDRLEAARISGRTAGAHGRLTLDDLVTGVWEGLAVRDAASCPVCEGPMTSTPHGTSGESPTGVCLSCGSRLS
jgi:hypothetical protein